ncbi:hypothetical protein IV203_037283 [Nitzschia inconspicua]|uniref:Uncharacterized protein n=1 Tax=Nitzschia inconspicua TaxID=303405 RepID=A0A9K3LPC0_9STRA|nr:hypothetical protein IV203_037283 [Nitzschia inconspicua]
MPKRVHPVPEAISATSGSISTRLMAPSLSDPLHKKAATQEEKDNQNNGDPVFTMAADWESSCISNTSRGTAWDNVAQFASTSFCATTGGCGSCEPFGSSDQENGGGNSHAPPWMDYLWLCEGDGKGRRNKRRSRRTRLFLQQQPSGSSKGKGDQKSYSQPFQTSDPKLLEANYAQLHEEFFEALLKEQGQLARSSSLTGNTTASSSSNDDRLLRKSESRDTCSSVSSGLSTTSSKTDETSAATSTMSTSLPSVASVQTLRKKHLPLQLHKLVPKGGLTTGHQSSTPRSSDTSNPRQHHHPRIPPIEAYNQMYNPAFTSTEAINLDIIMAKKNLKTPAEYVHQQCLLQKDKGRGERLKSCISARGQEQCLDKLREKIRLVIQMSGNSVPGSGSRRDEQYLRKSATNTGMKRRLAKVSGFGPSYIETRSMLELQLGFLSMQYGLLIHWDTATTGKIVFICLRKMCNDAFYSKIPDLLQEPTLLLQQQQQLYPSNCQQSLQSRVIATAKHEAAPPLVVRCHKGNHAIYQRLSGSTEVVLVDSPYRVPQPEVFAPSILTVDIHDVTGLDHRRSQWTLSVTFNGHTEIAHLQYNSQTKTFQTVRTTPCKWEMVLPCQMTSFDMAGLEIRLFEQRVGRLGGRSATASHDSGTTNGNVPSNRYAWRNNGVNPVMPKLNPPKKSTSRLASTMTMPLGGLVSQPSTSQTTAWKLTIPFTHDESAQLTLTLAHQSEYANWLYKELRARRKDDLATSSLSSWQPTLLKRLVSSPHDDGDRLAYHYDLEEDEADDFYISDWLCGICYLFPVYCTK